MQSPSDTPATGWPGAASACSKVTVVPSSVAKLAGPGDGVVDQGADEGVVRGRRQHGRREAGRGGRRRSGDRPASSKVLHWKKTPPVSRGSVKHMSGRGRAAMWTSCCFQVRHGRLEVLDLQGNRVHAAAEAGDELGRTALDDRLADLDGVVPDPGHAAAASDTGLASDSPYSSTVRPDE